MALAWDDLVVVGRIARAHGNRGQVIINPETDFPAQRFRAGREVWTWLDGRMASLEMLAVRFHEGRPVVAFAGIESIDAAERLAGVELRVPAAELIELPPGTYYRHDLVGCNVLTVDGRTVGVVRAVEGSREASRLVIETHGADLLVPLAEEICVEIAPAKRRVVIDPPAGLLELNRGRDEL